MRRTRRSRHHDAGQHGQALVEFALVSIVLFFLVFGLIDLMRLMQANTTVGEAARQAARQAVANADSGDSPFGSFSGTCSGLAFTSQASGTGCLTDAGIRNTVTATLGSLTNSTTLYANTLAANCPAPPGGQASICIAPGEAGGSGSYASCSAARTALGRNPVPGDLGPRAPEWTTPHYKGCFVVQVTVRYSYSAMTPLANFGPNPFRTLTATSDMLAEY